MEALEEELGLRYSSADSTSAATSIEFSRPSQKSQAELLGATTDLAGAGVYEITSTARAYLPLAPINLTVNGDGRCPTYGTGESVVVDWDMASPLRNLHPVEEDPFTAAQTGGTARPMGPSHR